MSFRNLFIKSSVVAPPQPGPQTTPGSEPEPPPGSVLPESLVREHPSQLAAESVEVPAAGPEQPTHIPHRALAPFRPVAKPSPELTGYSAARTPERSRPERASEVARNIVPADVPAQHAEVKRHGKDKRQSSAGPKYPRHSSGWKAMLQHLKEEPSQRILDIGPTSPNNINFLTGMGHSVYMADIVPEALDEDWNLPATEQEKPRFDEARFFAHNLDFGERRIDVVLLWATIDYLPDGMIAPIIARLHDSMKPGGRVLAFFHTRDQGPETAFCRYHLVDGSEIEAQEVAAYPVLRVSTNREIERLFKAFSGCKFFLARDNVYEVIITR